MKSSRAYGWGSIRDGVLLFQYSFLTGVLLTFSWDGVVIKSGAQMEPIRYIRAFKRGIKLCSTSRGSKVTSKSTNEMSD